MTKGELISKQQLEIEEMKSILEANKSIISDLHFKIHGIGQPLNDNCLNFNKDQMLWVSQILDLVEQLNIGFKDSEVDF